MKTQMLIVLLLCFVANAWSQDKEKEKMLEKRARDMHAALQSSDKNVWSKFITENYSPALIEKRGLDKIIGNFARVHEDFGDSKIISLAMKGDKFEMIVKQNESGDKAQFLLVSENVKPFRIEGVAIEVGDIQRTGGGGNGSGNGEVVIKN